MEDFHVAGVGSRAVEDFGRKRNAAHQFRQRRIFEIGEAGAPEFPVMLLVRGHEHVPQAFFLRDGLEVVHDLRRDPTVASGVLLLERLDVRVDVLVHERRNAGDPLFHLGGVFEVHGSSLFSQPHISAPRPLNQALARRVRSHAVFT